MALFLFRKVILNHRSGSRRGNDRQLVPSIWFVASSFSLNTGNKSCHIDPAQVIGTMAYAPRSPVSSFPAQPGFDAQAYLQQTQQHQQYRPSPVPSPRPSPHPSPHPSPQPYAYQQVNRPPPSSQYNQSFVFPPRSPQPPIQQSYRPPPSPQPIFPPPQGYTPPTQIPPSLQARVKTPAPPEQTTASPRPQYAYLPQQNVITSVPTSSPPRETSPSRPLPPPQRARPVSTSPSSRIQIPTSSFTENTLYRHPSTASVSPTRAPIVPSPGPGPSASPQPPVQALVHRPSYSAGSASPPKPVSSFGPSVPAQIPGQIPTHMFGQTPSQIPSQFPSRRSESPNRGRPLPIPTSRTPSPTKSIQPPIASRSLTDNTPQRQLLQQKPQRPPQPVTRSATEVNPPSSNTQQSANSSPVHRPTSSMGTISTSSRTPSIKEIALPPATTPGEPFVPYWKRNLQGGPREYGVQRRGTVAGGPSATSAATNSPQSSTNSFSSSNPPMSSFPAKPPSQSEIEPGARIMRKPTNSFDFGMRNVPGTQFQPQPEPQPGIKGVNGSKDFPPTPGSISQQSPAKPAPSQTSSAFSLHQRRGAEVTRSNTGPDPEHRSNPDTQPRPPAKIDHNRFGSNASTVSTSSTASTSGSGFSNRSTVPAPPKPTRSQTYDPKPVTRREESSDSVSSQRRGPSSPNKLSSGEKGGQPPARIPSPQYGILDMPRSRFSQRVEAKTEVLNGLRSRSQGSSPVRNESPNKSTPPVSPFSRGEGPTRNSSTTRSQDLPRPPPASPPSTITSPFPPALKRNSVTPQSVTLQMATMGIGEDKEGGRLLDQRHVQKSSSHPKPQQERVQSGITKSDSGWPSNLPRLPRTPATSQHPNSTVNTVNGAHSVASPLAPSNRVDSSHPSTSTSSFDRNPVRQNTTSPHHSTSKFSPREDRRRSIVDLDLDDAPPPSLRSPSPASSVASSNFSSFSAAMESYRNEVSGSGISTSSRNPHQRTGSVPVRQSTEPAKTSFGDSHPYSQSQPRVGPRQKTLPSQSQVQSQPQPPPNQQYGSGFSSRSHSPARQQRQQPPPQSPRRQPAPPADVNNTPVRSQSRSPIRTPQANSPQRQKNSFPANPESDSDDDTNGPRIAVSVADAGGAGPKISVSGSDNVPSISINVGGADDDYGNGPAINVNSGGPSVATNGGKKSVAELPTIRRDGGLSCGGCGGMIVGRVVSAMGAKWHPGCFRCCVCNELLENLSSYEKDGRSFCHLDYHEVGLFSVSHLVAWVDHHFLPLDLCSKVFPLPHSNRGREVHHTRRSRAEHSNLPRTTFLLRRMWRSLPSPSLLYIG